MGLKLTYRIFLAMLAPRISPLTKIRILLRPSLLALRLPVLVISMDLNKRELALLVPFIAAIIWLGVYPAPVLRRMEGSAQLLVNRVERATVSRVSEGGR